MAVASLRHQHPKGKFKIFSFRLVYRSVANHPFVVVALLFLICLHLYFPFLFSLFVLASPVLICTAMLLGTLLIHGQPNDNTVIYHEKISNASAMQNTGEQEYHQYSIKRDGIFTNDRFAEVRKDIVEKGMKASDLLDYGVNFNGNTTKEAKREHYDIKLGKGSKNYKDKGRNDFGFATYDKADVQLYMKRDYGQAFNKGEQNISMDCQMKSSLGRRKNANDANNHESSDCESNGAEKSSLDALVANVVQTPLETYPLLDSEDPLHLSVSRDASRKFDLQSLDSNQSSEDSSKDEDYDDVEEHKNSEANGYRDELANKWVEVEKEQQLENLICKTDDERDNAEEEFDDDDGSIEDVDIDDDDDDDDDDEDDNERKSNNADKHGSKQVTMWTEEDEKNLRLVGNSEFERDLRLENLLARRRAKRNFSMISEKNLIDLDRPVLPFHVAPISTTRGNPFDSPTTANYQQYNMPPIPGSAPISKQKRNPFDSPSTSPKGMQNFLEGLNYDEEPIEMNLSNSTVHESGSTGYNQGIVERNRKNAIFRRYESFNNRYNFMDEDSSEDFMETGRRDAVLRRHETFNLRSTFPNKLDSPKNVVHFKRKPFFVVEDVVGDQEERHSSMSHDSESIVSFSESDDHIEPSNTFAKHKYANAIKDTTEGDHALCHSENTGSEYSDSISSVHDDPSEEFMSSLEVNAELHTNQISHKEDESHDQNGDNASSNTSSMKSDEDHNSKTIGNDEDEDEIINDNGLSLQASSDGTIEPPVFDVSPSSTEKSTPLSCTHN